VWWPGRPGNIAVFSRPDAVVEVHHAVAETAFVQQFELQADIVGEGWLAAFHNGRDEEMALVNQPGLQRLGGEVGVRQRLPEQPAAVGSGTAPVCGAPALANPKRGPAVGGVAGKSRASRRQADE